MQISNGTTETYLRTSILAFLMQQRQQSAYQTATCCETDVSLGSFLFWFICPMRDQKNEIIQPSEEA